MALATAAFLIVSALSNILLLLFAGVLLASGLTGAASWLSRRTGLPAGWALASICLLLAVAAVLFFALVAPRFADETVQLVAQLRQQFSAVRAFLASKSWGQFILDQVPDPSNLDARLWATRLLSAATSTFGLLGSGVILIFTTLYLAASPDLYLDGAVRLIPVPRRPRVREVLIATGHTLRLWLLGQLIDMAVVFLLTFIGLYAIGVPLALPLALIAGLMNFVPYIGAVAGAVPALLIAFGQGPDRALETAVLVAGIQFAEGNLIAPTIQSRTVSLPPAVTILSQSVFGALFGFMGLVLAPALAAAGMTLIRKLYVADVLGDRSMDAS